LSFHFFFSSRRRHTRFSRDWSSDVCSSDLGLHLGAENGVDAGEAVEGEYRFLDADVVQLTLDEVEAREALAGHDAGGDLGDGQRSEERRVGKECRSGWSE